MPFIIIFNSAKVNNILHKFTTAFQKGKVQQNLPLFFVSNAKFKDEIQAVIDFGFFRFYNIDYHLTKSIGKLKKVNKNYNTVQNKNQFCAVLFFKRMRGKRN